MSQKTHEIKLRPSTSDNDMSYRAKWAENWLKDGDKVKITVNFKGREMKFTHLGQDTILKFLGLVPAELWTLEGVVKLMGRNLSCLIRPKGKKEK